MDPDEALRRLRELAKHTADGRPLHEDELQNFGEIFIGLDEWLSKGGFPPKDWKASFQKQES